MKFAHPSLMLFKDEILKTAERYALSSDDLFVETFIPGNNAILVETVQNNKFRVHINLQENRIIAAKHLNSAEGHREAMAKYTAFMK